MNERKKTREALSLTHRAIESLKPEAEAYRVPDRRCQGLAVRIAPSGLKTWDLAYRIRGAGRMRRLSLGPFPAIGLDAARQRAQELVRAAKAGRDMVAEQKAAKRTAEARMTVGGLIDEYVRRQVRGRLRTATEIEWRLKRALAGVLDRKADDLRRRDIRQIILAAADRGALREAEKQRVMIGTMFRWALGEDIVETDPTAGLQSYSSGSLRDRILSADEIRVLWTWLDELPGDYAEALRVQLATGARIGEIAGMRSVEVDQNLIWTLPAARSKNGRDRVTPLVGIAADIVRERIATLGRGPLFAAEKGEVLSTQAVASMLVKRRPRTPIDHFTSHDLRRTVATGLVDLGIPYETVAAVLGHEVGGAAVRTLTRHYVRSNLLGRKKAALETWDAHLRIIIEGRSPSDNVLPFSSTERLSTEREANAR